jgi:hypothetical protein
VGLPCDIDQSLCGDLLPVIPVENTPIPVYTLPPNPIPIGVQVVPVQPPGYPQLPDEPFEDIFGTPFHNPALPAVTVSATRPKPTTRPPPTETTSATLLTLAAKPEPTAPPPRPRPKPRRTAPPPKRTPRRPLPSKPFKPTQPRIPIKPPGFLFRAVPILGRLLAMTPIAEGLSALLFSSDAGPPNESDIVLGDLITPAPFGPQGREGLPEPSSPLAPSPLDVGAQPGLGELTVTGLRPSGAPAALAGIAPEPFGLPAIEPSPLTGPVTVARPLPRPELNPEPFPQEALAREPAPGGKPPVPKPPTVPTLSELTQPVPQPQTEPDPCKQCKQKKKSQKKKPRNVCYRGTYTELKNGLRKYRKEQIPCR